MERLVYLDNAATTQINADVLKEMLPYYAKIYSNPSGIYAFALEAKKAVDIARERVALLINAEPEEIYFTSGGTESDNWAISSALTCFAQRGNHIITTKIEHPAILNTCSKMEKAGCSISYIDVDKEGMIRLDELENAINDKTVLITIMFANNEVGTIQPIEQIGNIARKKGIVFHTDAVQAFGQIPIDVKKNYIDMMSVSAHKLNGPKGVGCLYIKNSIPISPFMYGGSQENKKRAGTHNVPGIVGLGKAAEIAKSTMNEKMEYEIKLRDYMIERIQNEIPYAYLNGSKTERLPNNVNFSFEFIEGESLLIMLDGYGICASSGSACSAGSKKASHVLTAMGISDEMAHSALRLTLSEKTSKEEIDFTIEMLKKTIENLRKMSTEYGEFARL